MILKINIPANNTILITDRDLLSNGKFDNFGKQVFSDVSLFYEEKEITLIHTLITVELQNTIVTTPVQGRRGTVKEYISAQDYIVTLSGSITRDETSKYPIDDVIDLVEMIEKEDRIEVVSEYLSIWHIQYLVMDRYTFPQYEGRQNQQMFDIRFISDKDIQLLIEEEE